MTVDGQIAFDYWNSLDAKSRRIYMWKLLDQLATLHNDWSKQHLQYGDHRDDAVKYSAMRLAASEIGDLFPIQAISAD